MPMTSSVDRRQNLTTVKVNLLDFDRSMLTQWLTRLGVTDNRADRFFKWLHGDGQTDFTQFTEFSQQVIARLNSLAFIRTPEIVLQQPSRDGTIKWVLRLLDGNCIETVYIPDNHRGTLCVSSQVGCALNCSFCQTGKQGFNRNLSTAEIIGQVWVAVRALSQKNGRHDRQITNIVMMGMGEPLMNTDCVISAMDIMMDDHAYGFAKRRVTLSTSGVVPAMRELAKRSDVALAVSLHAPDDELRNILVPINKKYPLEQLMSVCREYFPEKSKRTILFEYVMLDKINDSEEHARKLIKLLTGVPAKINLIPFNPFSNTIYKCSSRVAIEAFRDILQSAGFVTRVRKTRGEDIDSACGQLVGEVQDKTRRSLRLDKIRVQLVQKHQQLAAQEGNGGE